MRERSWYDKHRWRLKHGLPEVEVEGHLLDELKETEWSPIFERYMRNRRLLGAIRYGRTNQKGKPIYDRVNTMRKKIDLYERTKNKEALVDLANYAMVEFQEPTITGTYFEAIDDGEHDVPKNSIK